jgi:hypothetical protein
LDDLPERSRSFPAGATTIPAIASASLYVKSDAILPDFGAPIEPFVEDSSTGPAPQQSVSAVLVRRRAPEGASGWTYDAMARSSATRSLSASGDVLTVAGTGSRSADLTVSGGPPLRRIPSATVGAAGGFVDAVCLDLSRPSLAAYNLTSNGPAKHPGFGNDLIFLTIADHPPVAAPGNGTAGGTRTLAAGRQCFGLFVHSWVCTIGNGTSVECTMPRTLEWSYTVTVRPAP